MKKRKVNITILARFSRGLQIYIRFLFQIFCFWTCMKYYCKFLKIIPTKNVPQQCTHHIAHCFLYVLFLFVYKTHKNRNTQKVPRFTKALSIDSAIHKKNFITFWSFFFCTSQWRWCLLWLLLMDLTDKISDKQVVEWINGFLQDGERWFRYFWPQKNFISLSKDFSQL